MVSSMFSFILVKQKRMGVRTELACRMWLCGAGTGREGGDAECEVLHALLPRNSAPQELKIASRKNTVNPKQVSFVFPMNVSVLAFSRTVI